MTKDEFNLVVKKLHLKQAEVAELIGKGVSSVQKYSSGKIEVPKSVALILNAKVNNLPKVKKESTAMNVSNIDKLTIEEMVNFCIEDRNKEEFLELPAIKLIKEVARLEGIAEGKEYLIFQNLKKK